MLNVILFVLTLCTVLPIHGMYQPTGTALPATQQPGFGFSKPLEQKVFFQYGLNQTDPSLNGAHVAHCCYYALYFALSFNNSCDYKASKHRICQRTPFDTLLRKWETYICQRRELEYETTTPMQRNWLFEHEVKGLISHQKKSVFWKRYNHLDKDQRSQLFDHLNTINLSAPRLNDLEQIRQIVGARHLESCIQKYRASKWNNITVIWWERHLGKLKKHPILKNCLRCAIDRLHSFNIPQSVLIRIGQHLVCLGFRKEENGISMTIHNSCSHPDRLNYWYKRCQDLFCNPPLLDE